MLKKTVLFTLVFLSAAMASESVHCVPAKTPNAAYPLHVQILSAQRTRDEWDWVNGFGRGNLLGDTVQGLDYTYQCDSGLIHNKERGEFYQARWKKPGKKMELLLQEIGGEHMHKCELNVTLHDKPYGSR